MSRQNFVDTPESLSDRDRTVAKQDRTIDRLEGELRRMTRHRFWWMFGTLMIIIIQVVPVVLVMSVPKSWAAEYDCCTPHRADPGKSSVVEREAWLAEHPEQRLPQEVVFKQASAELAEAPAPLIPESTFFKITWVKAAWASALAFVALMSLSFICKQKDPN